MNLMIHLTNWISAMFTLGFFFIDRLINLKKDYHWPVGLCTLEAFLPMSPDCQTLSLNMDLSDAFARSVTLIIPDNLTHFTFVGCKILVFNRA